MVGGDATGWMAPRPHPTVPGGVTGVTPWRMGDPAPPYNGGVSWEGLRGSPRAVWGHSGCFGVM